MRWTNIYLAEVQSMALDKVAHAQGVSRAELIRQLLDTALGALGSADLEADLAAIRESFGVLRDEDLSLSRGVDERARHLERVARL
jgi:hypothetical protein